MSLFGERFCYECATFHSRSCRWAQAGHDIIFPTDTACVGFDETVPQTNYRGPDPPCIKAVRESLDLVPLSSFLRSVRGLSKDVVLLELFKANLGFSDKEVRLLYDKGHGFGCRELQGVCVYQRCPLYRRRRRYERERREELGV